MRLADGPQASVSTIGRSAAVAFHRRLRAGREIGYWIHPSFTEGLATRAAQLLTNPALAVDGITHAEIHHDNANVASARVPRRLGLPARRRCPDDIGPSGNRIERIWRVDRDEWTHRVA